MGSCTRRHFLLSICFLQLISTIERQIFDFLGYMWAPILANFFQILFVIFGFYGAYHFRPKYIISYFIWNFIWIGWNVFLICFYLDIGILNKDSDILNLGTGSVSWFEVNGYGCKPTYPINITSEDPYRPVRPERVDNCLINYPIVETIHCTFQFILSFLAIIGAVLIGNIFLDDDDRLKKVKKNSKRRQSLYSIEFGPPVDTIRSHLDSNTNFPDTCQAQGGQLSPKPMTPRRVKRRSVMTRGSNSRQSGTSRRSSGHTSARNSVRNSRRKFQQNPVTKLIDQQGAKTFASFSNIDTFNLNTTNMKSLNTDINTISNKINQNNFPKNINPDPIYYNTNGMMIIQQQGWNSSPQIDGGHYNPTYQHSNINLATSTEQLDEIPNNRPPSVRSSYSNFHGTRPLSSYNPNTENVFVGITGEHSPDQNYPQQHFISSRRTASRESIRSMAFLNSGPPAYNLNYHTPPDSETTM